MTMTLDEAIKHCVDVSASCQSEECAEMHLRLATWLGELQKIEQDGGPGQRAREAAQILIEKIGAPGPESCVETAKRAVAVIKRLMRKLASAEAEVEVLKKRLNRAESIIELHYDAIEDDRMTGGW